MACMSPSRKRPRMPIRMPRPGLPHGGRAAPLALSPRSPHKSPPAQETHAKRVEIAFLRAFCKKEGRGETANPRNPLWITAKCLMLELTSWRVRSQNARVPSPSARVGLKTARVHLRLFFQSLLSFSLLLIEKERERTDGKGRKCAEGGARVSKASTVRQRGLEGPARVNARVSARGFRNEIKLLCQSARVRGLRCVWSLFFGR